MISYRKEKKVLRPNAPESFIKAQMVSWFYQSTERKFEDFRGSVMRPSSGYAYTRYAAEHDKIKLGRVYEQIHKGQTAKFV